MTYNIRVDFPDTSVYNWKHRRDHVAGMIKQHSPDILAVQEALYRQNAFLEAELEEYAYWGVGRDDGDSGGETCAIFFKDNVFALLETGNFWLSATPDTPSIGWDAMYPRICSYVKLKFLPTGDTMYIFNTHFDHVGEVARERSAGLILDNIREINPAMQYPVILTGDLNAVPGEPPIELLNAELIDSYEIAEREREGPVGTYNAFKVDEAVDRRIDYVYFLPGFVDVHRYLIADEKVDGRYPSDHFPVIVEFSLKR
jgi:endonuclease/exonuclease/phosphatase family metal-dependent hydrolase